MPMTLARIKVLEETATLSKGKYLIDGKHYTGLHLPVDEWVELFKLIRKAKAK